MFLSPCFPLNVLFSGVEGVVSSFEYIRIFKTWLRFKQHHKNFENHHFHALFPLPFNVASMTQWSGPFFRSYLILLGSSCLSRSLKLTKGPSYHVYVTWTSLCKEHIFFQFNKLINQRGYLPPSVSVIKFQFKLAKDDIYWRLILQSA